MKFPKVFKDSKPTSGEDALRKLERKYPNESVISDILTFRKTSKLISTFLEAKFDEDGRMRTSYNTSGTETGRISSSKNIWGTGMNLQNIPVGKTKGVENIRHLYIAGKGNVFVKGDLSQAETRVVAEILKRVGDETLSNLYKDSNFDIHKWMAGFIYNKLECDVSKEEREVGKLANHSGNYGAGPKVLMARALKQGVKGIDWNTSQKILDARHRAIPGLRIWWRSVEAQLLKTRTITTCFGRRRIFFGRLDDSTYREAYAFEPQSLVADVCNSVFTSLSNTLDSDCWPLLQVHDEVVIECPKDKVDYVVDSFTKASFIPLFINEIPLIIPIDISIGPNWRDTTPYE